MQSLFCDRKRPNDSHSMTHMVALSTEAGLGALRAAMNMSAATGLEI
jgi:hypothetical protein